LAKDAQPLSVHLLQVSDSRSVGRRARAIPYIKGRQQPSLTFEGRCADGIMLPFVFSERLFYFNPMKLSPGNLLHVYNRGNNRQQIFFNENNYRLFKDMTDKHIKPCSDILAYCLMPNHFHFLIHVNENSCKAKKIGSLESTELTNGFRMLLSSYAKSVNKEFDRTGSIFQQNTKFKLLNKLQADQAYQATYAEVCFHYIHQNPIKAGLVAKMEDWNFSSFNEYLSGDNTGLCNKDIAFQLFDIKPGRFYDVSRAVLNPEFLKKMF
jgi:REP-associated tyrosine transposase